MPPHAPPKQPILFLFIFILKINNNEYSQKGIGLAKINSRNSTIAEYTYNFAGKRTIKNEYLQGGVNKTTYYIGSHFETTIYSNGTEINTSYYYANGERVAKKVDDGSAEKRYFIHGDHLGSTSVITNESGEEVEKTKYYPYGATREGGEEEKYLFTGQERDAETGLYYYGARYYSPEVRRFVQADPIVPYPYDPQSLNRYSYVRNNPIKYVDPTGNQFYLPRGNTPLLPHGFTENCMNALASHRETTQYYLENNPDALWEAGSFDVGPMHVKPGAIAEKMHEGPAWFVGGIYLDAIGGPGKAGATVVVKEAVKKSALTGIKAGFIRFRYGLTKETISKWGKGTFDSVEESIKHHFKKHGAEVGAKNANEYTKMATNHFKNSKDMGREVTLNTGQKGVEIVDVNKGVWGRYTQDGEIISYGKARAEKIAEWT